MRIVSIVGARPQFVKLAPVSRAMASSGGNGGPAIEDIIIHTGQHYDAGLSDIFFSELDIPQPTIELEIGSGSHGVQTARMLEAVERTLLDRRPDIVVVYGDTNSTLAGALAAAKLNIPIAHVEAGLRSFDRDMPEEVNRIMSDHVSDILFAPTATAMENLARESLSERSLLVGDVMLDAIRFNTDLSRERSTILEALDIEGTEYGVATMHRAINTDTERLKGLLYALNEVAKQHMPIIFPVHPRTVARIKAECPDWKPGSPLKLVDPVGYLDMIRLLDSARLVLTDSGGLQKEAFFLNTPCITLREETEWPETVEGGGNVLAGADPGRILAAVDDLPGRNPEGGKSLKNGGAAYFGDGKAAEKIVAGIIEYFSPSGR